VVVGWTTGDIATSGGVYLHNFFSSFPLQLQTTRNPNKSCPPVMPFTQISQGKYIMYIKTKEKVFFT